MGVCVNDRSQVLPKTAVLEQIDVQQLGKSINFCLCPFDDAPFCRIGDEYSVFGRRDQANQLSHDLCRILRHKIGNCRGSAFKCDEGGWVDIDAIINDYGVDLFPPNTSRERRYMGIIEVMKWQDSGYKKSRFQILAVRFPSIMNPNDMRARSCSTWVALRTRSTGYSTDVLDGTDLGVSGPRLVTAISDSWALPHWRTGIPQGWVTPSEAHST